MPEWVGEAPPVLRRGDQFYVTAFWRLSTCRQIGMSTGPIPYTAIQDYAEKAGFDSYMCEVFVAAIYAMDNAFEEHKAEQRAKTKPKDNAGR